MASYSFERNLQPSSALRDRRSQKPRVDSRFHWLLHERQRTHVYVRRDLTDEMFTEHIECTSNALKR